jgi:tetratricopeptide (TPR) repeat protein
MAVAAGPENSNAYAVRAFVLDWTASNALVQPPDAEKMLLDAEQDAVRALQYNNKNTLALAYYAEILSDQRKWLQAEQYIQQAMQRDPSLMDVHRVNAYVLESLGDYNEAINEYKKAAEITPNMTFLYIRIGANLRQLKRYDEALAFYDKAARINENLGLKDPIPYLAIAKTYSQTGDFFVAARNVKKALKYNPNSPDVYGQLGIIYFKSRNYEGSIPAFQCAIYGCDEQKSCDVRECDPETDAAIKIEGMPLTPNTVVYYYTYGSVLAGLHRKSDPKCEEAIKIFQQVRKGFGGDTTIMAIIQPSEDICASFGYR